MGAITEVKDRIKRLDDIFGPYIPPRETWTPAEEAVYRTTDPYRVLVDEAQEIQFKAIKHAFTRHYTLNDFYHRYCEEKGVAPDDLNTNDDLERIPLIPDATFKQHPSGKDFAYWIAGIFTGELPTVVIDTANPTFDDVINAFNAAGITVTYSNGTSGLLTVIPRDQKTMLAAQYSNAKSCNCMMDLFVDQALSFVPNPAKTNLDMPKHNSLIAEISNVHYALDFEIPAELIQKAMSRNTELKGQMPSSAQSEMQRMIADKSIQWLEHYDKTKETILLGGPPFLLLHIMNAVQKEGKCFDFGERGSVLTGGGWKTHENAHIAQADFRRQVQDVLGIPETHCIDGYSMTETNVLMLQCPEGHYLHAPYTYFKPLILDNAFTSVGYGEWGRFAFLDALAQSYPGFIISGDRVRMLEHCPVCDRPGPVFEPEIYRAKGEEVRGCAEVVARVLEQDLKGGNK